MGGGPAHAEGAADVLPRLTGIVRLDGELALEDPELSSELVGDDQADERIGMRSEQPFELLTTMAHGGLLRRVAFRRAGPAVEARR